jgi:DNA-binding PadR family transcriptional regulator
MVREFFLGFIEVHILHHAAAKEPVYGLAPISELRHHGDELSAGRLYPVLHDLDELLHADGATAKGTRAVSMSATPRWPRGKP